MKQAVGCALAHYTWCSAHCRALSLLRWNTAAKMHYMIHIAEQSGFIHPRAGSTYIDEDFMGRMKRIARKCTGGVALYRVGNIVLAKFTRGLALRWMATSEQGLQGLLA